MFARVLAAGGVLACMGFLAPAAPEVDQRPPRLHLNLEPAAPGSAAERRSLGSGARAVQVRVQAVDDQSLAEISVTALGTFRCATRDGSREAPFEVVVSLPTLQEHYPIKVGQSLLREAEVVRPLAVQRVFCGRYTLDAAEGPVALYARSGEVLLRARVRDHSGHVTESRLKLTLGVPSRLYLASSP